MYSKSYDSNFDLDSGYSESRDKLNEKKIRFRERSGSEYKKEVRERGENRRYSDTDFSNFYKRYVRSSVSSEGFVDVDDEVFASEDISASSSDNSGLNLNVVASEETRIDRRDGFERYQHLYRSVDVLNLEGDYFGRHGTRHRSDTYPRYTGENERRRTRNKSTQTPPLEQVLLEMRMERDLRAESGDSNWVSVYERSGDPDWRQLGREMRYLADDWGEYSQEIEDEGKEPGEKSIWRSILETLLYVKPKVMGRSIHRRSVSMCNLGTNPLPRSSNVFHSRSLANSPFSSLSSRSKFLSSSDDNDSFMLTTISPQSSVERDLNVTNFNHSPRSSRRHSISYGSNVKRPNLNLKINDLNRNDSPDRRRSQSFSAGCKTQEIPSDNEEIDLDLHLSTPYSEQWERKHYNRRFEKCAPRKERLSNLTTSRDNKGAIKMTRLEIPIIKTSLSDDDDVTPEIKYLGMASNDKLFEINHDDANYNANVN